MIDFIGAAIHPVGKEFDFVWGFLPPRILYKLFLDNCTQHLAFVIHFQPRSYNGVAHGKPVGEKGSLHVLVHHIEPQRQFTQFNGRGVQVNAINVMSGNVGFYFLKLIPVPVGIDPAVEVLLLVGKVGLSQLVDDLILEGSGTHGRFKNFKFQQFGRPLCSGFHFVENALEGVFDGTASQYLRGIVGG